MNDPGKTDIETDTRVPLLSIVIISWKTRDILSRCLASVFEYTTPLAFEVIVIDNASNDGSVEMIKTEFPTVKVVVNESNLGTTRACNQGMSLSRGQLILLLGSDTFVLDDVIARMAHYVLSRAEIAMAGCQLRYPDGRLQRTAFRSLSIWRSIFEDFWLYKLVSDSKRDDMLLGGYWAHDAEKEVDWIAGPFMMLRREVFERFGGLSEEVFMHGDDNEWCTRVKIAGRRIFYNPIGVVYHIGSVSSAKKWDQKEWLRLCHLGGLWVYSTTNGRALGLVFHFAKLCGTAFRFAIYSILTAVSSNDYYRHQLRLYGWQCEFYVKALIPGSGASLRLASPEKKL